MTWCYDANDDGSGVDADDGVYADMMTIALVLTMMITMALILTPMMTVSLVLTMLITMASGGTRIFWGVSKGQNVYMRGQKLKQMAKNG